MGQRALGHGAKGLGQATSLGHGATSLGLWLSEERRREEEKLYYNEIGKIG